MTRKQVTCILCPNGCELDVSFDGEPTQESIGVEGNLCPRGVDYGLAELVRPTRTLTTSVLVRDGDQPLASVKTSTPIPRHELEAVREALRSTVLDAPVEIGDVVARDLPRPGVDVVVTRPVGRRIRRPGP